MITLIRRLTELADQQVSVATMLCDVPSVLRSVLAREEWLPASHKAPHPDHYQQYLPMIYSIFYQRVLITGTR